MTDYAKLKVAELKALLKQRGIPSTGLSRKQQICEALGKSDALQNERDGAGEVQAEEDAEESAKQMRAEGEAEEEAGPAATTGPPGGDNVSEDGAAEVGTAGGKEENGDEVADEAFEETEDAEEDVPVTKVGEKSPVATPGPNAILLRPDATPSQPIVLEKDAAVSREPSTLATPEHATPSAEPISSDLRKRKRRSPTPPLSEGTVSKKLKAAEEAPVTLPEDTVVEDTAANFESAVPEQEEKAEDEKAAPFNSNGDDDDSKAIKAEDTTAAEEDDRASEDDDRAVATTDPAMHLATRALYIRDLVRPLQPQQLRDHLVHLATPPGSQPNPSLVTTFHLGAIRTHALATFNSISAAARARSALHNRIWPEEPARKPLWVDFVPEEKVTGWIDAELGGDGGGNSRRDMRRWEVVYTSAADYEGGVLAEHREVTSSISQGMGMRQPSLGSGQGMPNAPLGPRASRPSVSSLPPNIKTEPTAAPRKLSAVPAAAPNPPKSESFNILDTNFPSTNTKPKLYFKPVSDDLVEKRLEELRARTSRDWDEGRGRAPEGQLRRYTFEDGERLVDGGPDIGRFGRGGEEFGSGGGRRGRGGGGGGGFYGGGGDRYWGRR